MAALQGYTIRLYRELEEITGQSCSLHHVGGLTLAESPERLDFLKSARAMHRHMGLDTELVTPEEIRKLSPITNTDGVLGALYDPLDGHLDPSGTTHAYAKAAQMQGAEIILRNPGARDQPACRRELGGGDRAGHDRRRAAGQCRRPVGARSRRDGGRLPAAAPDGAPVFRDRRYSRSV